MEHLVRTECKHDSWFEKQCVQGQGIFDRPSFDLLTAIVKRYRPNAKQFVDVGAHVGSWTMGFLSVFPDAQVTAIEPCLENLNQLKRNLDRNVWTQDRKIYVHHRAVGTTGETGSRTFRADGNSGQAHIAPTEQNTGGLLFDADITSLNMLMGDRQVDVLKIDVEGYEYKALRGASALLAQHRPVIHLELNGLYERYGDREEDIRTYLKFWNYTQVGQFNKDFIFVETA